MIQRNDFYESPTCGMALDFYVERNMTSGKISIKYVPRKIEEDISFMEGSITPSQIKSGKGLDALYDYGFDTDDLHKIREKLNELKSTANAMPDEHLCFERVYEEITQFARDKEYIDGNGNCLIPLEEFRAWFSEHKEFGWEYKPMLKRLKRANKLDGNGTRNDYRTGENGPYFYRFVPWGETRTVESQNGAPVPPADHEQETGGAA